MSISEYFSTLEEHTPSDTPPPSSDENISEIGDLFEFMNRDRLLMEIFIWFKESYEQAYTLSKLQNKPNFRFGSCYSSTGMGKTSLLKTGMKKMIQNVQEKYTQMLDDPSDNDEFVTELQEARENDKFSKVLQNVR
jgi:hypothetical protein